ncbi:MAG: hypothetical protein A2381_05550 [Bdellovibrionales bacterium RIFOXYB1_FULL_37_110]|nr:MAG: hypothetical protein A2417_15910 [Bdellovibrionales bacterium RIFOXYC1_FULL_37_79]OFZ57496.1 MAG: hypothetical protein A2381_05550 [Bdellovibrionales bacterium RIFOXYB1_FULL_37_110]OFZ63184.1 MAG: hypothetical protein A2577_08945 [Bdellovibrionales bacterium RIFOXYD1_FULL_36_51]
MSPLLQLLILLIVFLACIYCLIFGNIYGYKFLKICNAKKINFMAANSFFPLYYSRFTRVERKLYYKCIFCGLIIFILVVLIRYLYHWRVLTLMPTGLNQ